MGSKHLGEEEGVTTTTSASTTAPAAPERPRERPRRTRGAGGLPYGLVLPTAFLLLLSLGYPLTRQVFLSFHEYGLAQQFGRPADFVGLDNYRALVTDPYLWKVVVPLGRVLPGERGRDDRRGHGGGAADAADGRPGPAPRPGRAAAGLGDAGRRLDDGVDLALRPQYGVINWTLTRLGVDYEGHNWLLEPLSFFFVATVIVVWMSVPFVALHRVRRAHPGQRGPARGGRARRRRRLAAAAPRRPPDRSARSCSIVVLLQIIWDLRVFTQIYVLQEAGGVTRDTNLLGTYIYRLGIGGGDFGTASAVAIFMLA